MRDGRATSVAVLNPGRASRDAAVARRWPTSRWVTMVAAVLLIAPAVAFVVFQSATPSLGSHLRPGSDAIRAGGFVVSPLGPGTLQDEDRIVSIAGVDVGTLALEALGPLADFAPPRWVTRGGALGDGGSPGPERAAAVLALGDAWVTAATIEVVVIRDGEPLNVAARLQRHPVFRAALRTWGTIVFALVSIVVASFVFARRPDASAARVLFVNAAALLSATTWSFGLRPVDWLFPTGIWLFEVTTVVAFMIYWTSLFHFTLVFPRRVRLARLRGVVPGLYALPITVVLVWLAIQWRMVESALAWFAAIPPVTGPHAAVFLTAALVTVAWQYRTTRSNAQRKQIRWVVLAGFVTGAAGLSLYIVPPLFGASAVSPNVIGVVVTMFPLAVAIAVLRYQLFDIDTLLQRALVYGLLTAAVAGVYLASVAVVGILLPAAAGTLPALAATLVAAAAFQPVRDRLQRVVNRALYGERDEPATVLGRLGERLEGTLAPDAVLPTLVQTVAQALKLPYAAIRLGTDGSERIAAEYGHPTRAPVTYPLAYRGRTLGTMALETRGSDEPFTKAESALLAAIARQAGVAAYAVQTTADLRRSRERLVAAREEERRRLRRDLHDGLGPALAGLTLKLDAAANTVERDAGAARKLLVELRGQTQTAIDDLRRLVHALRPPALDDLGLVGALREQTRRWSTDGLSIDFDAPDGLPEIPAAIELAAYRIVHEALANVVRHAKATRCRVVVEAGRDLNVVVVDDGCGISDRAPKGLGLDSMRERAEEVGGTFEAAAAAGGGTRVRARLPLESSA